MLISEYMGKPGLKPRALEFRLLTVIPMCLSKQLRGDNVKEMFSDLQGCNQNESERAH